MLITFFFTSNLSYDFGHAFAYASCCCKLKHYEKVLSLSQMPVERGQSRTLKQKL